MRMKTRNRLRRYVQSMRWVLGAGTTKLPANTPLIAKATDVFTAGSVEEAMTVNASVVEP